MRRSIFKWAGGWGELCLNPTTDDFRFDLVDFVVRMLLALYYLYMVLSGTTSCISGNLYLLEHFYQSVSPSFSTLIPSIAKSTYYRSHISWWELLSLRLEPRVELDGSSELLYILLLVSIPGEVKYPTSLHWKCVTCRGLHHSESDLSYHYVLCLIHKINKYVIRRRNKYRVELDLVTDKVL